MVEIKKARRCRRTDHWRHGEQPGVHSNCDAGDFRLVARTGNEKAGTGADVMKRIAAPMVGGIITSTICVLVVYPAIFYLWRSRAINSIEAERSDS